MKKTFLFFAAALLAVSSYAKETVSQQGDDNLPVVYMIKEINPENIIKVYEALGRKADGNNVAVKISTGESEKSHHLDPKLIGPFVKSINGTLVECNTAYKGNRYSTEDHLAAAKQRGYFDIANVDIMDADGDTALIVKDGFHLPYNLVGKHFLDYDFMVVLSHFKGHQMGGFGGALKNISIGIASSEGKSWIHSAAQSVTNLNELGDKYAAQDAFLESMADASQTIINRMGDNILYINVANNLSVDCDCNGNPSAPEMADLGILASLDPVALDQASCDLVFNTDDTGNAALIERINSRHGLHLLEAAEQLGLGSRQYKLVVLE